VPVADPAIDCTPVVRAGRTGLSVCCCCDGDLHWPLVRSARMFFDRSLIGGRCRAVHLDGPTDVAGDTGPWLLVEEMAHSCACHSCGSAVAADSLSSLLTLVVVEAS
jgi:hypothetical protein